MQHPAGELSRAARLFGKWHELSRRDVAELRVLPSDQGFETLHRAAGHRHLGLEVQRQGVLGNSRPKVGNQCQPATVNLIGSHTVAGHFGARVTGILERDLDPPQQLVGSLAMLRKCAHGSRYFQVEGHSLQVEPRTNDASELVGVQSSSLERAVLGDHEKLTLRDANHGVDRRCVLAQTTGRLAKHVITDMMAERAVNLAHVSHVEQDQGGAVCWFRGVNEIIDATLCE